MGIVFLRIDRQAKAEEVGQEIEKLWQTYKRLQNGRIRDVNLEYPDLFKDLTALMAYGPRVFELRNAVRKKPNLFSDEWSFIPPRRGGCSIVEGSNLMYSEDLIDNHAASDDIIIQFISENQFVIGQAITETWRTLSEGKMGDNNQPIISMTTFYTGFIRRDNRGWLGFHDGISNMNEEQRKIAISIGAAQVNANDDWIISGTFMAFIRIVIDLPNWWKVPLREQELMIGRDKTTGCPIIGIDKNNIPLKDKRCPVPGSKEVTDKGNEIFRDHPAYGQQKLPAGISDDVLKTSHIGAMRILDKVSPWEAESNRIYRQGYEFLESTSSFPGFKAGLNFISFQNNPQRVFNIMTKWGMQKNSSDSLKLNRYFSVVSAGVFLVPPSDLQDRFPGSSIYFKDQIAKRNQQEWQPSPKYSERFRIR